MSLLIVAPYYNNSHFIPLQMLSFDKYIKDVTWKLLVLDDSTDTTVNCLTGKKEDIQSVCYSDSRILYEKIPSAIHRGSRDGPTRHRNILNYFYKLLLTKYKSSFEKLLFFDADMCFTRDVYVTDLMDGCAIAAPRRKQWLGMQQCSPLFKVFDYLWVHCIFFDLKKVTNLEIIDMSAVPRTTCDSGSMIKKFMIDNPSYTVKYHTFSTGNELIEGIDCEFFYDNQLIHFGSGSRWDDGASTALYISKFNNFKRIVTEGLSAADEELIRISNEKTWKPKQTYQLNHPSKYCTDDEFMRFIS